MRKRSTFYKRMLVESKDRRQRALSLRRILGLSFEDIGWRLGVSRQRAHQMVEQALNEEAKSDLK